MSYHAFETDDPTLFMRKVRYILENDVTPLDLTFVDDAADGTEAELIPGGAAVAVTNENKHQYLDALAKWRCVGRVEAEARAFAEGMWKVLPDNALSLLNEQDLELLLCGVPTFSIDDLQESCHVSPMCDAHSVTYVFHALRSFSHSERARFLQFVTGQAGVPAGGFAAFSPRGFSAGWLGA